MNPVEADSGLAPRVVLITEIDFWQGGAGHRARILALVGHLAARVQLTVLMPTAWPADAWAACQAACPAVQLRDLGLPPSVTIPQGRAALQAFMLAEPQHACIIEYLSLGWLRAAVPRGVLTLVDTHDVASQRDADFARAGHTPPWPITTQAEEQARLRVFDQVLAISAADAALFTDWLGAARVLLTPHAHAPCPQLLRANAQRVLFVGSPYLPNRDGLAWLLREVWPRVRWPGAVLDVVGDVGRGLAGRALPASVQVHGRVADLTAVYAAADVCVNPVRFGSGLKIKSVEALAHGRPLVCTRAGARGVEAGLDQALVCTDDAAGFAAAIDQLLQSMDQRQRMASAGLDLVAREFNPAQCYGPLLRALQAAAAPDPDRAR